MDTPVAIRRGETEAHLGLKRLALLWAQANGYSACAAEVSLPQCRYRADVAAYRRSGRRPERHRDFRVQTGAGRICVGTIAKRPPHARTSRFRQPAPPGARETSARPLPHPAHRRLAFPGIRLARFRMRSGIAVTDACCANAPRCKTACTAEQSSNAWCATDCANLFFLVLPGELFRESEVPNGLGRAGRNKRTRSPCCVNQSGTTTPSKRASDSCNGSRSAGTRQFNRALAITREEIVAAAGSV